MADERAVPGVLDGADLVDNGGPASRAECRLCGYATAWDIDNDEAGGDG